MNLPIPIRATLKVPIYYFKLVFYGWLCEAELMVVFAPFLAGDANNFSCVFLVGYVGFCPFGGSGVYLIFLNNSNSPVFTK